MVETSTTNPQDDEPTIDLLQYVALFRQFWWLIFLAAVLAGSAAYLVSSQITPVYQASATIMINEALSNRTADYNSLITSERLAQTYAQMITKRPVLEKVINRLGLNLVPDDLSEMVTVTPVRDTQLIVINVEHTDPGLAAMIANTLIQVFSEQIQETQSQRFSASKESLQAQIAEADTRLRSIGDALAATTDPVEISRLETRLNQYEQIYTDLVLSYEQVRLSEAESTSNVVEVEPAVVPDEPIKPRKIQNTIMAAVVGLMLAVGGVFAYDALDDTIKNPEEINRVLHLPIMGTIAAYTASGDGQLITRAQPRSPVSESFRALRTNVQYASVDTPLHTLLVTSPAPGDGKSTVLANLAVVMAQGGRRVTVMDADLHRPRAHRLFGVEQRPGLSLLFIRPTVRLNGSLQATNSDRLKVISAGDLPPNPSELLGSNRMREILNAVLEQSDLVLIDTPPVLSVTDAVVLAPLVDGVLVVVRPGQTKMNALKYAIDQLNYVGANVVGVVLNEVNNRSARYGYYYKSYYYKQYKYYRYSGRSPEERMSGRRREVVFIPRDPDKN